MVKEGESEARVDANAARIESQVKTGTSSMATTKAPIYLRRTL